MSADGALEVKVIFDASSRGRRRGARVSAARRRSRPVLFVALGLLNLVAAAAAYSFTWWRADPFLYITLIMRTPVPGVSLGDVDQAFASAPGGAFGGLIGDIEPSEEELPAAPTIVGLRATEVIGITAYAWLTIATLTSCALALAAGSLLGRAGGSLVQRLGMALLFGLAALLAYGVLYTLTEFGRHYPPRHLRIGMGGLTAIALMLGVAIGGRTLAFCRLASVFTIVAGVATALALYLGHACGAIDARHATPTFLAITLIGVSAWGWLLIPLSARWAR